MVIKTINLKIDYLYDASGKKLKQTVTNGTNITARYYAGTFEYEGSSLKMIHNQEGRVRVDGTTYMYDYYLRDHLGNTMVCFTKGSSGQAQILQRQSYYPFVMSFAQYTTGSPTNRYLYNGKEFQNDFGLDWYDYGARFYDPQIGRWHSPDPLIEDYYNMSPYNYAVNNPIFFIEPDGNGIYPSIEELTKALEEGLKNPAVQNKGEQTFCNVYIILILNRSNDFTFGDYECPNFDANTLGFMMKKSEIAVELTQEDALKYAKQCATVFTSYIGDPGHLGVVDPNSGLVCSGLRGENVISVYNVGPPTKHGSLAYAYGNKNPIKFYILKKDKDEIDKRNENSKSETKKNKNEDKKINQQKNQTIVTKQNNWNRLYQGDFGYKGSMWENFDYLRGQEIYE